MDGGRPQPRGKDPPFAVPEPADSVRGTPGAGKSPGLPFVTAHRVRTARMLQFPEPEACTG